MIMNIILSTIFLNLFISITTLSIHSTASGVIYDSSGNKLLRGVPYYILPLLRGSGGGLTVSRTTKDACPLDVTQEPFEVNHGVPFTFNPIVLDEDIIRGAYPISIEVDVINPCSGSKIWKVVTSTVSGKDDDDEHLTGSQQGVIKIQEIGLSSNRGKKHDDKKKKDDDDDDDDDHKHDVSVQIVTTDGEFNKPESCFQIVEENMMPGLQSYQIQNCPFKCGSSSTGLTCYNVGVVTDANGKGYLGRTDAVFPVVFTNSYGTFSRSAKTTTFSRWKNEVE